MIRRSVDSIWKGSVSSLLGNITYYVHHKDDHTDETLTLAKEHAEREGIQTVVLASTTGATARRALEVFRGSAIRLVIVPHQFGFSRNGNAFPKELANELRAAGHEVFFGTMLFHTEKLYGNNAPALIASFLRCFSQGVKVCFEIALMAADAGLVAEGERIVSVAGTARGADTALVMQAAPSVRHTRLRVSQILCKPLNELPADGEDNA